MKDEEETMEGQNIREEKTSKRKPEAKKKKV